MRRAGIWIVLVGLWLLTGWLIVKPFANETRAIITGKTIIANAPVQRWIPYFWPVMTFLIGMVGSVVFQVPIDRILRVAGLMLGVFCTVYGLGIVMALSLGQDGFLGLFWAHGSETENSTTLRAMNFCPMTLAAGTLFGTVFAQSRK